ncbi:MAG: hypothetical protein WBB39_02030 [Candidatus Saccharimonadales bacterium]
MSKQRKSVKPYQLFIIGFVLLLPSIFNLLPTMFAGILVWFGLFFWVVAIFKWIGGLFKIAGSPVSIAKTQKKMYDLNKSKNPNVSKEVQGFKSNLNMSPDKLLDEVCKVIPTSY